MWLIIKQHNAAAKRHLSTSLRGINIISLICVGVPLST